MATNFESYSYYYNLLYKDKDYLGETLYIQDLFNRYKVKPKSILDLGCGTGNHSICLAQQGFYVHGVDLSKTMLVEANRQCYSLSTEVRKYLQFSHGDVRSFNLEQTFDAAILLFHVLSYQISNNDIISTFKAVNYHLQPGGIFIFDMWYGPAVLSNPPLVRIKRLEDEKVKIIRIAEPTINYTDSVVDVNYQILVFDKETHSVEEIHETHRMRYLFCPELDSFLEDTNFRTLEKGEWLTTDSLNNRTWSAYRVVQKIA